MEISRGKLDRSLPGCDFRLAVALIPGLLTGSRSRVAGFKVRFLVSCIPIGSQLGGGGQTPVKMFKESNPSFGVSSSVLQMHVRDNAFREFICAW